MKRPACTAAVLLAALSLPGCLFFHGQRFHDFTARTPLGPGETLILGFMGGRDSWDDGKQGVRRLALRLRSLGLPAQVETVENKKRALALQLIREAFDRNRDGSLDAGEKASARLIVYGQSFGGAAVVKLARQLHALNVPVQLTVQIDSIGRGDGRIPPNVARALNLYQRDGWIIQGQANVRAEDPGRTEVENRRFRYRGKKIDTAGVRFDKKLFRVAHTKMGLDPDVWRQVESAILETVRGGAGTHESR